MVGEILGNNGGGGEWLRRIDELREVYGEVVDKEWDAEDEGPELAVHG